MFVAYIQKNNLTDFNKNLRDFFKRYQKILEVIVNHDRT